MSRVTAAHLSRTPWLALGALLLQATLYASEPPGENSPTRDEQIQRVQGLEIPAPQPPAPEPPAPPAPTPPAAPAAGGGPQGFGPTTDGTRAVSAAGTDVVAGGAAAPAVNATDVAGLLTTGAGTGVETQQRNPIMNDPRVRGYRVGQLVTWGDGAFYHPARLDLDTAVGKFDPSAIRDVIVLKGPWSVRYGPGFSFIDIATLDSPRNPDGFKMERRTSATYQINGERFSFLQSLAGGAADWGFRATYDFRDGNDYHAGDGRFIPSSYNSQNLNVAFGFNLSENQTIELKALRLYQHDVEFAGLYFDVNRLDTEAYNLRYTSKCQNLFDLFTFDLWDNHTRANGDTTRGAKQAFLTNFFQGVFNRPPQNPIFDAASTTNFHEGSRGYRAAATWGQRDTVQFTVGTDLNYWRQGLFEFIRLQQVGLIDPNLGPVNLTQDLTIPACHMVDPGIFLDLRLPVNQRLTLTGGLRTDIAYTTSTNRFVDGTFIVVPGTQVVPTVPGQIAPPVIGPRTSFDPILFSARPDDGNLNRHFNLWAAYLTLDYKIDEHWTGFAKAGYAERPPTLTELYAAGPFIAVLQQGLTRLIGDPHLAKERLKQMDVGLQAIYPKVRAGAVGFYAWIEDFITYDQNRAVGGQITQVVFTNTDLATLMGGEMYAEVDVLDWLTPFITVSYVQGRDLTHIDSRRQPGLASSRRVIDTEPLPGIPPLELRSGFRIHDPCQRPRWAVEFSARSVMGQNLVAASLNEQATGGFTIFNVRSFWQATDQLLLTAGVENLGDKFYREHLDPRSGDQLFRPGINIYFGAEVRY